MKERHDEPVTKADLAELRRGIQADLNELRDEIDRKIESAKDEIIRHVGVLDENMRRDVFGARAEEIADLEESRVDHERRIRRLEKSAGLIAA
jgi:hypothetical protein